MDEGRLIGNKWRVVRLLGRGSMGRVYEVRHKQLPLRKALKQLHTELAEDSAIERRFVEEARRGAALEHPNIVRVADIDFEEGAGPYIVMDLVEGETLAQRFQAEDSFDYATVLRIGLELASALDCAHRLGVIHRDIKPANVLLESRTGRPMLTDFGIAKKLGDTTDASLTGTGLYVGTVRYSSREQLRNEKGVTIDGRADIYSLGVVLYEMVTGRRYLEGCSEFEIASKVGFDPEWSPELEFDVEPPADFRALLERCMAADREDRIGTATELITHLEGCRVRLSGIDPGGVADPPTLQAEIEPGLAVPTPSARDEPTATAFTVERMQQLRDELNRDAAEYETLVRALTDLGGAPDDPLELDDISRMLRRVEEAENAGQLAEGQRDLGGVRKTLLDANDRIRDALIQQVSSDIERLEKDWTASGTTSALAQARHTENMTQLRRCLTDQDWPGCSSLLREARSHVQHPDPESGPTELFSSEEEELEAEAVPLVVKPSRGPGMAIGLSLAAVAVAAGSFFLLSAPKPAPEAARPERAPAGSSSGAAPASAPAVDSSGDDMQRAGYVDHIKVAQFFLDRGNYAAALSELESALELRPGDSKASEMSEAARRAQSAEQAILRGDD